MPAPSPGLNGGERVNLGISLDGEALDSDSIVSIEIWNQANRIPRARIVIFDGDPSDGLFPLSSSEKLKPGTKVELSAGYGSDLAPLHSGILVRHCVSIPEGSSSRLVVETADPLLKMTLSRNSAVTANSGDSDILSALLTGAGGTVRSNDAGSSPIEAVVQYHACDWDMLLLRAEANGCIVLVDGAAVKIVSPTDGGDPVLTVGYGDSILSFEATVDAALEYSADAVTSRSWDYDGQKVGADPASGDSDVTVPGNFDPATLAAVFGVSSLVQQTGAFLDDDRLGAWSAARLMRSKLAQVQGRVSFQGSSLVTPGSFITLAGVGDRFNGDVFVGGVLHVIRDGQWTTTAELGMPAESFASQRQDIAAPPAAGLAAPIRGLHTGQVAQVATDPAGNMRVQVTLPLVDAANAVWARLGQFYASNGFGAVFYPEVGDEVIVGFMDEDPANPIVLGSVYSSGRAAVPEPSQANDQKALTTRSKLQIGFDDSNTVLTISTPGGRIIRMDDTKKEIEVKDGFGNSILMGQEQVKIVSGAKLVLQSTTDMEIQCGGSLTVSATAKYALSAPEIGISADTSYSIQSDGMGAVKASAELTVNGALVKIN